MSAAPPRKTHRAALVVIPPRELWAPIQAIRERHDAQYQRWMPHITLLYPFRPRERLREIRRALAPVCAASPPFDLTLARFDHFRQGPTRFVLWLAPEPAAPLSHLHRALVSAFADCDDTRRHAGGYRPHLTVGQLVSRPKMRRLLDRFAEQWQPIRFRVDRLAFIARDDRRDTPFRVVAHFPLGASPSGDSAGGGHPSRSMTKEKTAA